ncbi:MAG TPA: dimethylsulfonioproprionate lyase family protein [Actinomycetota bacterium]|nr:dimethylsulfonioproprionate lyase family protein [Actinomycetota bacterium]
MTDTDPYFATDTGLAATTGRFVEVAAIDPIEILPGLVFRPVAGERVLVNFVHFEPNTEAPMHDHEEEQVVVVLEGEIEFDVDGDVRTLRPGEAIHLPPHVPHAARTHDTSCSEMDIFAPPRRALVALMEAAAEAPQE